MINLLRSQNAIHGTFLMQPYNTASQERPMKLLNHTADKATLELTRHELHLANALIQEGRISHKCDSPEGQELEDGFRSILIRLEEAVKAGIEFGGTH